MKIFHSTAVLFVYLICLLCNNFATARPEFAARHGITRCTGCHVSPVGGGPRNMNGKQYGAHNFALSSFSQQDFLSLDFRGIYYRPDKGHVNSGGMGIMASEISANLPISKSVKNEFRIVTSYNLGGFTGGGGERDAYVLWKTGEKNSLLPQYIAIGRMHPPFGLLTDEHRTYARIQTKTTWNDFDMAVLFSSNPFESLHYDLAFVNGERSGGKKFSNGDAENFGAILNLRWTPTLPVVLGSSFSTYDRKVVSPVGDELVETSSVTATATSMYMILPLDRLTNYSISGFVNVEYSTAENWNFVLEDNWVTNPDYQALIEDKNSSSFYIKFGYELSQNWLLVYKFDELILDTEFPTDYYQRHGIGSEHHLDANTILKLRVENALARPKGENEGAQRGKGALSGFFALLQVAI